ncbi:MAG: SCP2 sterol-binding domain-containing protein [Pseudomonadota bacterium]
MLPNPLRLLPRPPLGPPRYLLAVMLNRIFRGAIDDGDLEFLQGSVLRVVVSGTGIQFDLTLAKEHLKVTSPGWHWDLRISGSLYDFMLLAARREDADTLFFQRRLRTEGDTELGLFLKNFLDSQELSEFPLSSLFEAGLHKAIAIHEKLMPGRSFSRN